MATAKPKPMGTPTKKTSGSRLSKSTKSAVKSSGLKGAERRELRQALRTPGTSKAERKIIRKSGISKSVVSKQTRRSTSRAAGKRTTAAGRK